jgi:O-antigen ligase
MVILYFILIFISSYLYVTPLQPQSFILYALACGALIAAAPFQQGSKIGRPLATLVFLCFIAAAVLSCWVNSNATSAVGTLFLGCLYFVAGNYARNPRNLKRISIAFFSATIAICLATLIYSRPESGISYAGIFVNPNSTGGVFATFGAIALAHFLGENSRKRLAYALLAAFAIGIVLLTRSRGSLASLGLCVAIVWFVMAYRSVVSFRQARIFVGLNLAGIVGAWLLWPVLVVPLLEKVYFKTFDRGDVTDGRYDLWSYYLSESVAMGRGRDFLLGETRGAHNTFISITVQYGWIAGIAFLLFCIIMLWRAYRFAKIDQSKLRYLPLFACLSFLSLSMIEGMMMKSAMLVMFFMLPVCSEQKRLNRISD